jgi:L-cysteine S-thiosulfotransferase
MYVTRLTQLLIRSLPLLAVCMTAYADAPAKRPAAGPALADWPCYSYTLPCGSIPTRAPRMVEAPTGLKGDPDRGRALAHDRRKGNCLTCHIMQGGTQPGTVGPDLSRYGTWGRTEGETYARIFDPRAFLPHTAMPPFGTNELLTEQEVMDIVIYLQNSR